VYHTENFKNGAEYTQSHSVLGMKALFKQLDQITRKSRTWTKDNIPFENLKIGSLQAVISISKVRLKPENLTSKTG
jgi:hypothetical protein